MRSPFARGLGAARLRYASGAQAAIASLDQIHDRLATMGEDYRANQIDIQRREVSAVLAYAVGQVPDAIAKLQSVAAQEGKSELASVTPGPLQPASETLGEIMLDQERPAEALTAFKTSLQEQPNRFWSLYGAAQAARLAGDLDEAKRFFETVLAITLNADRPRRPEVIEAQREVRR